MSCEFKKLYMNNFSLDLISDEPERREKEASRIAQNSDSFDISSLGLNASCVTKDARALIIKILRDEVM